MSACVFFVKLCCLIPLAQCPLNKKAELSQRLPRDAPDRTIRQYAHGLLVPIAGLSGPK